ncbi:MAG: AlkZ family DNA glycosylase [Verrucomicrobia bacterium]|nr:AlkZ family DNA glycosylase [Verrucomicrobiota bacterium]
MNRHQIAKLRVASQQIAGTAFRTPGELVSWLGAVQAQDFLGSLWSIGLRLPGTTQAAVEQAIANRSIIRTWPLRGTLHFVVPSDARWMLKWLTAPAMAAAKKRHGRLNLDEKILILSEKLVARSLSGGNQLSRDSLYRVLESAGISTKAQRGYHILWWLAQKALICCAARNGKQPQFALLDEWIPAGRIIDYDAAIAELALRYFTGHGPATLRDFAWWSGLSMTDAKQGLDGVSAGLVATECGKDIYWMSPKTAEVVPASPQCSLLPAFDEFLLGYADRSASLGAKHVPLTRHPGGGMFKATIAMDGRIIGTWNRTVRKTSAMVALDLFAAPKGAIQRTLKSTVGRYAEFLVCPVEISLRGG